MEIRRFVIFVMNLLSIYDKNDIFSFFLLHFPVKICYDIPIRQGFLNAHSLFSLLFVIFVISLCNLATNHRRKEFKYGWNYK